MHRNLLRRLVSTTLVMAMVAVGIPAITAPANAETSDVLAAAYGSNQAKDVQRSPASPTCSGGTFNSFTVSPSGDSRPRSDANGSPVDLTNRYLKLTASGDPNNPWGLALFNSSDQELRWNGSAWVTQSGGVWTTEQPFAAAGDLLGASSFGFLHNSHPGQRGTFLSNGVDLNQSFTYAPAAEVNDCVSGQAIAKASALDQLQFPSTPNESIPGNNPPALAPATPGKPSATGGNAQAAVTVTSGSGGGTAQSYTVTASPGGATCTISVPASPLRCTVSGLTNGTPYTFTARATNTAGSSANSVASDPVTPTAPAPDPDPDEPTGDPGGSPVSCADLRTAPDPTVELAGGIVVHLGSVAATADCDGVGAAFTGGYVAVRGGQLTGLAGVVKSTQLRITSGQVNTSSWASTTVAGQPLGLTSTESIDLTARVTAGQWGGLSGDVRAAGLVRTPGLYGPDDNASGVPVPFDLDVNIGTGDVSVTGATPAALAELGQVVQLEAPQVQLWDEAPLTATVPTNAPTISGRLGRDVAAFFAVRASVTLPTGGVAVIGEINNEGVAFASRLAVPDLTGEPILDNAISDESLIFSTYETEVAVGAHTVQIPANSLSVAGLFNLPEELGSVQDTTTSALQLAKFKPSAALVAQVAIDTGSPESPVSLIGQVDLELESDYTFNQPGFLKMTVPEDLPPSVLEFSGGDLSLTLATAGIITFYGNPQVGLQEFTHGGTIEIEINLLALGVTVAIALDTSDGPANDAFGIPGFTLNDLAGNLSIAYDGSFSVAGGYVGSAVLPDELNHLYGLAPGTQLTLGYQTPDDYKDVKSWLSSCLFASVGEEGQSQDAVNILHMGVATAKHASILLAPRGCQIGGSTGPEVGPGIGVVFNGKVGGFRADVAASAKYEVPSVNNPTGSFALRSKIDIGRINLPGMGTIDRSVFDFRADSARGATPPSLKLTVFGRLEFAGTSAQVVGAIDHDSDTSRMDMFAVFNEVKLGGVTLYNLRTRFGYDAEVANGLVVGMRSATAQASIDIGRFGKKGTKKTVVEKSPFACGTAGYKPCAPGEIPQKITYKKTVFASDKNKFSAKARLDIANNSFTRIEASSRLNEAIAGASLNGSLDWSWRTGTPLKLKFDGKASIFDGKYKLATRGSIGPDGFSLSAQIPPVTKKFDLKKKGYGFDGSVKFHGSVGLGYRGSRTFNPYFDLSAKGNVKACLTYWAFGKRKDCASIGGDVKKSGKVEVEVLGEEFTIPAKKLW